MGLVVHVHTADADPEWHEHEHKRDKTGKFSKSKSAGMQVLTKNKPMEAAAKKAGYEPHRKTPLKWVHPAGGKIEASPGGYWTSLKAGKFAKTGKGAASLSAMLSGNRNEPAAPAFEKPNKKAAPVFEHPVSSYHAPIEAHDFKPVQSSPTTQTYENPDYKLVIGTQKLKAGNYAWKIQKKNGSQVVSGKGAHGLSHQLHQLQPGTPNVPPPGLHATPSEVDPDGKTQSNAIGPFYEPGLSYKVGNDQVLLSKTTNAWAIVTPSGGYFPKTLASGTGQKSLNAAFEALHPRGAGGKFLAKPGTDQFAAEVEKISGGPGDPDAFKLLQTNPDFSEYQNTSGTFLSVSNQQPHVWGIYLSKGSTFPVSKGDGLTSLYEALNVPGKSETAAPASPKPAEVPPVKKPKVDLSTLTKVGEKLGSNPGGQYEDADGKKFYVKKTASPDHARNENLAATLYALAGANTLQYRESNDPHAVVTEMEKLEKSNVSELTALQRTEAKYDFAIHAWLANWDAAGLTGDNVGVANGKVTVLDVGGSLAYRAQGAPKGNKFGTAVTEWDSLRNPTMNPSAGKLFGDMTPLQLKASAERLKAVTPQQITDAVKEAGYTGTEASDLSFKLIYRRSDILNRASAETATTTTPAAPKPAPPPEFVAPFDYQTHPGPDIHELDSYSKDTGTSAQRTSIKTYTGGTYQKINRALRFGFHGGSHEQAKNIANITNWLDQQSMPEEVVCTRRVSADYAQFLLELASKGTEFTDFGFCSTSRSGHWSGSVTCQVKIPKGAKAASVKGNSQHPGEDEVLIQRGSRFKVVDFNSKTKTIYVELNQDHLTKTEEL